MDYCDVIVVGKGRGFVRVEFKQIVGGVSQAVFSVVIYDVNSFLVLAVITREGKSMQQTKTAINEVSDICNQNGSSYGCLCLERCSLFFLLYTGCLKFDKKSDLLVPVRTHFVQYRFGAILNLLRIGDVKKVNFEV